jgi:hypothetical protein
VNDIKENKDLRNQLPDYRQQYVNDDRKPNTSNQIEISNEKRLLTLEDSLILKPSHDFEQNFMNITRTTFISNSINSFAANDAQFTRNYSLKNKKSPNPRSLLVRAYYNQENQKSILDEKH